MYQEAHLHICVNNVRGLHAYCIRTCAARMCTIVRVYAIEVQCVVAWAVSSCVRVHRFKCMHMCACVQASIPSRICARPDWSFGTARRCAGGQSIPASSATGLPSIQDSGRSPRSSGVRGSVAVTESEGRSPHIAALTRHVELLRFPSIQEPHPTAAGHTPPGGMVTAAAVFASGAS